MQSQQELERLRAEYDRASPGEISDISIAQFRIGAAILVGLAALVVTGIL
jgi:hypothetical protein